MTTIVTGECQGRPYHVVVGAGGERPVEVLGNTRVRALLEDTPPGTQIAVTPTGPFLEFDPTSEEHVLAWLRERTRVLEVSGGPRRPAERTAPPDDGRVY